MRVMFTSTWGHGHVFPLVPLARAFLAAGHAVRWVTNEPTCSLVRAAGIDVQPGGLDGPGVEEVIRRLRTATAALPGAEKAAFAFPHMFGQWATPPMKADLLPLAREWRPDLLIHEPAELAAPLVGALLGVSCVTHSWGAAVPAPFLAAAGQRLAGLWAAHGLEIPPYAGSFESGYLDLCPPSVQTVSLDHITARQALRPVLYSGERRGPLPAFLLDDDPRPLAYLTLGTVANAAPVLATAIKGLTGLGARVLVTVGPQGDPAALGPQPDTVCVERWVRQSDVLPRATVMVSHGGSGTFLGALGHGLPQVCLPQAADQFRNAAAAISSGTGLALMPDEASPSAVEAAVRRVVTEDGFRQAAALVAKQVDDMPAPDETVILLTTQ